MGVVRHADEQGVVNEGCFVSNGLHEEGVDQGGVSREFFQLLVSTLVAA